MTGSSGDHFRTIRQLSPTELDLLADVEGYLSGLQIAHMAFSATITFLIWDIILTWDQEIRHVWTSRWSIAKCVFFLNRYLAPLVFLVQALSLFWIPHGIADCIALGRSFIAFSTVSGSTASFVLASRLWALYGRDKFLAAALITGFLVCLCPGWVITLNAGFDPEQLRILASVSTYTSSFVAQNGYEKLDWRFKRCIHLQFSKWAGLIIIGSLTFESGIVLAMLWKMYKDKERTKILEEFYRDGLVYYAVIFCSYAVALGSGFAWHNALARNFVTSSFYIAIKSIMCSRIILRLRSYFDLNRGEKDVEAITSCPGSTIIMFARPGEGPGAVGIGGNWTVDSDSRGRPPLGGGDGTWTDWTMETLPLERPSAARALKGQGRRGSRRLEEDQSWTVALEMDILGGVVSDPKPSRRGL